MQSYQTMRPFFLWRRLMSTQKSSTPETYYDILNLRSNCNGKDIRNAYVELTKKYHPDVSGEKSKSKFVKISEAYRVLSKPYTRAAYDQDLLAQKRGSQNGLRGTHTTEMHRPWEIRPDYNPNPVSYYGIKDVPRISNGKIALLFLAVGVLMSIVGFASVNRSFSMHRDQIDEKSVRATNHHATVRADAEKYGNAEQLRRMAYRMQSRELKPDK